MNDQCDLNFLIFHLETVHSTSSFHVQSMKQICQKVYTYTPGMEWIEWAVFHFIISNQ